LNNYS